MGGSPRVVSSPAELLGLPPGFPHVVLDVPGLRVVLLLLGVLWVLGLARRRRLGVPIVAAVSGGLAFGFWALTLRRPWGLLIDDGATLRLGEIAVAAARGVRGESMVVGADAVYPAWSLLLAANVPAPWVSALPTILPVLLLALLPVAVAWLWRNRPDALLGASLVVAFGDSPVHAVRGLGLVSGLWARPEASWLLLLAVSTGLLIDRLAAGRAERIAPAATVLSCLALGALCPRTPGWPWPDALLALSLDHGPWLALAGFGFLRERDPVPVALVGGGIASAVANLAAGGDPWLGVSVARVGVLLAAAGGLRHLVSSLARRARDLPLLDRTPRLGSEAVVVALAFAAVLPASSLFWWSPLDADPVATRSLEAVSPNLDVAMSFVRERTPKSAVFVASPAYAGAIGALGERRVLRVPGLVAPGEARRVRAEGPLLLRRPLPERFRVWGVTHVFAAPGDFLARGVESPESLALRPGLELLYADLQRFHVYQILPDAAVSGEGASAPVADPDPEEG